MGSTERVYTHEYARLRKLTSRIEIKRSCVSELKKNFLCQKLRPRQIGKQRCGKSREEY